MSERIKSPIPEMSTLSITRNDLRDVVWELPENDWSENTELAVRNVQGLFLQAFPEFDQLFPRVNDGFIERSKAKEAREFVLDRLGSEEKFIQIIGSEVLDTRSVPYFSGSYEKALSRSFRAWGIKLGVISEYSGELVDEFIESDKFLKLYGQTLREIVRDQRQSCVLAYVDDERRDWKCLHEYTHVGFGIFVNIGTLVPLMVDLFDGDPESYQLGINSNHLFVTVDLLQALCSKGRELNVLPPVGWVSLNSTLRGFSKSDTRGSLWRIDKLPTAKSVLSKIDRSLIREYPLRPGGRQEEFLSPDAVKELEAGVDRIFWSLVDERKEREREGWVSRSALAKEIEAETGVNQYVRISKLGKKLQVSNSELVRVEVGKYGGPAIYFSPELIRKIKTMLTAKDKAITREDPNDIFDHYFKD